MKRIFFPIFFLLLIMIIRCSHLKEAHQSYEMQDYKKTITLCLQALENDSEDTDAMLLLAKSFRLIQSYEKALETIKKAYRLKPTQNTIIQEFSLILQIIAEQALEDNNPYKALHHYTQILILTPGYSDAYLQAAEIYFQQGQLDKATTYYNRFLEITNDTTRIRSQLLCVENRIQKAQIQYQEGITALKQNQIKTSRYYFKQAIETKSDFPDALYHFHLVEGQLLYNKGSKGTLWDAIEHFGKASALRPGEANPHFWLARSYEKKDRDEFVNAIDEYIKALDLEPNGPLASECGEKITELKQRKDKMDHFWGRKK